LKEEHTLTLHLLELCCERVRWTSELIEDSAFLSTSSRLAKRLLSLAAINGEDAVAGTQLKISQSDLANFLSISRQLVNQYLQEWCKSGWVELGRGSITLVDAEALRNSIKFD
ncbi:MAG: Crp/Fnr family transcriptional regulator, partial [Gammaproteobacteria bacterium]